MKSVKKKLFYPKKACQGCHISEGARQNFVICTSFWSILHPRSNAINDLRGNKYSRVGALCMHATAARGSQSSLVSDDDDDGNM